MRTPVDNLFRKYLIFDEIVTSCDDSKKNYELLTDMHGRNLKMNKISLLEYDAPCDRDSKFKKLFE